MKKRVFLTLSEIVSKGKDCWTCDKCQVQFKVNEVNNQGIKKIGKKYYCDKCSRSIEIEMFQNQPEPYDDIYGSGGYDMYTGKNRGKKSVFK